METYAQQLLALILTVGGFWSSSQMSEYGVSSITVERQESLQAILAFENIEDVFRLIVEQGKATVPTAADVLSSEPSHDVTVNTAFIIMQMSRAIPDLEDVCNAIKDVCSKFGIAAVRADDIETSDRITDVILERIRRSEFLIADLTGERPNVYYEVGYAHALNERPILYRRANTPLHFDLLVHNVPEYASLTDLKAQLTRRFEAILGRGAP